MTIRQYPILLTMFALLFATACGDSSSVIPFTPADGDSDGITDGDVPLDGDSDGVADGDGEREPLFPEALMSQNVEWRDCPLFVDSRFGSDTAECADIEVPLFWDDPEGETIGIRAMRLLASQPAKRQVWLLQGGPGGSGIGDFGGIMKRLHEQEPELDLYTIDHRGVGYSTRMGCPEQEAEDSPLGIYVDDSEWDACLAYIENDWLDTDAFTVSAAATDVAYFAELMREEKKALFIYGVSYGSYWAHRYAQIFPDQADGVILDSVAPGDEGFLDQFDILGNSTVEKLMAMCAEDEYCHSKMGDDPYRYAMDVLDSLSAGHCPRLADHGIIPDYLKMAAFTVGMSWQMRVLIPAIFYRAERCEPKDVHALIMLVNAVLSSSGDTPSERDKLSSNVLFNHIAISEMLSDDPPSAEEMLELYAHMLAWRGVGLGLVEKMDRWPVYPTDEFHKKFAPARVPMLMLNGTLDLQTPIEIADNARQGLTGEHQYFFEVPFANHFVVGASPVTTPEGGHCGQEILLEFMRDPLTRPSADCLERLQPVDFKGSDALAYNLMVSQDIFENPPVSLDCGVSEGFFESLGPKRFSMSYKGKISDPYAGVSPGFADAQAVIGDTVYQVDEYYAYAYEYRDQLGAPMVLVQSIGDVNRSAANEQTYHVAQLALPNASLESLKESGETETAFNSVGSFSLQEIHDLTSEGSRYTKTCTLAINDDGDARAKLALCAESNTSFSAGESLQVAVNVPLIDDETLLGECVCVKDSRFRIDCAQYDEKVDRSKKAQRIGSAPAPYRFRLPNEDEPRQPARRFGRTPSNALDFTLK